MRIFIGYDSKEPAAFAVCAHSILTRASRPVSIVPLNVRSLAHEYTRERKPNEATAFSLTRFLVPHLSNYEGFSLFMDCDMLVRCDIHDLMLYPMADPEKAVYVCKHDYVPKTLTKFDGNEQTKYPRKNWSSVVLWDNAKCKALTPEYVNAASGLELHRFAWTSDDQIGSIPLDFNWLVGEYDRNDHAKILHYTNGTPCFAEYATCDHSREWWDEYRSMLAPAQATERALSGGLA